MILHTEEFVHQHCRRFTGKGKLASHCTGMYEEISSHWNKIRRCCEAGDIDGAFMAACSLQQDLDYAKITIGESFDLMTGWNPRDLPAFRCHCDAVEQDFIRALRDSGIPIRYTDSPEQLKRILTDSHDDDPDFV